MRAMRSLRHLRPVDEGGLGGMHARTRTDKQTGRIIDVL